jgi:hypothetical protein
MAALEKPQNKNCPLSIISEHALVKYARLQKTKNARYSHDVISGYGKIVQNL